MDNGLVVESNLPVVAAAPLPTVNGSEEQIEEEQPTEAEPASVAVEM